MHCLALVNTVGGRCTLFLDVRDVQPLLQSKDHNPKLQIKGVARRQDTSLPWTLTTFDSSTNTYCIVLM